MNLWNYPKINKNKMQETKEKMMTEEEWDLIRVPCVKKPLLNIPVNNIMATKHKNKKVNLFGLSFDSKKEASRYLILKQYQENGLIKNLELQKTFSLIPAVILNGRRKPAIRYVCDFYYEMDGKPVIEDVKSPVTRKLSTYRIKAHLMKHIFNIDIKEI